MMNKSKTGLNDRKYKKMIDWLKHVLVTDYRASIRLVSKNIVLPLSILTETFMYAPKS